MYVYMYICIYVTSQKNGVRIMTIQHLCGWWQNPAPVDSRNYRVIEPLSLLTKKDYGEKNTKHIQLWLG